MEIANYDVVAVGGGATGSSAALVLGCDVDEAGFVTVDASGRTIAAGVWAAAMWSIRALR
jgi:thioredoxin reductase